MTGKILDTNIYEHPKGLWIIAVCIASLAIGFGIINSLLVLYTTTQLKIPAGRSYTLFATYNSLLFTLPLIGGYVGEKLGYKRAFLLGVVLTIIALILLSFTTIKTLYWGLGFFAAGVSLYNPTYLVIQGKLYAKDDKRRESGFTASYIIMNCGFLMAAILGGVLASEFGYSTAFIIGAVFSLLTFVIYYQGRHHLVPYKGRILTPQLKWSTPVSWLILVAISIIIVLFSTWLLEHSKANNTILFFVIFAVSILIVIAAIKRKNKLERKKLIAFLMLSYISIGFWALYTLEPSLLTIFIKNNINRSLFGLIIPPSTFYGLDPFFIIILGSIFTVMWLYLAKRNMNPSLPAKFTTSVFSMGFGFFVLILGVFLADQAGLSNMIWVVIAYFFLATGELLIGPIGYSMVGRLAPEQMEGRLMGVWQLFTGFAGALSGYLANFAVMPKETNPLASNPIYTAAFAKIAFLAIALGFISLTLIPYIRKLIRRP